MSWFASSANETEAAKEHVCMFIAVAFDFPSSVYRFWSGYGDLTLFGNTFTGTGELGKITTKPENTRLVAETKTFQLSGVDLALVNESDLEGCFGRPVTEYIGFLDQNGQLVADPEINWEGLMDKPRRVDGLEPIIEINAEHRLALIDQADGWRYTHEHHQQFFPGDNGCREVPSVETAEIYWGGYRVMPGGRGGRMQGYQTRRR